MNKEDIEFLKELQHEMLTQDTVCQANPRFWVVMQTVKDYWVDDDINGICIYDTESCEAVFEGEDDFEKTTVWLKETFNDIIEKCEYDNFYINIVDKDGDEFYIDDISDIENFLEKYDYGRYSICYYRERDEIVENTMFLTLRECKQHIEANRHHYNNSSHPYAMTAYRSSQVKRLYEILEETDWDSIENN